MTGHIGILSLAAAPHRPGSPETENVLLAEDRLAARLRDLGFRVTAGGSPFAEPDQVAAVRSRARIHIHTLREFEVEAILVNLGPGTPEALLAHALRYLELESGEASRVVLFADPRLSPSPPAALEAASRRLAAEGIAHGVVTGDPIDPATTAALTRHLDILCRRARSRAAAREAAHRFGEQHILVIGDPGDAAAPLRSVRNGGLRSPFPDMETLPADALFALAALRGDVEGTADARGDRHLHEAALSLLRDAEATLIAFCDPPDPAARNALARVARALSSGLGPDGRPAGIVPAAAGGRVDVVLAQSLLHLAARGPARTVSVAGSRATPDAGLEPGPATLAVFAPGRRGLALHLVEVTVPPVEPAGSAVPCIDLDPSIPWPCGAAALAPGLLGPALIETAECLRIPWQAFIHGLALGVPSFEGMPRQGHRG